MNPGNGQSSGRLGARSGEGGSLLPARGFFLGAGDMLCHDLMVTLFICQNSLNSNSATELHHVDITYKRPVKYVHGAHTDTPPLWSRCLEVIQSGKGKVKVSM